MVKRLKIYILLFLSVLVAPNYVQAADKDPRIAMVLWRGMTEAERGFQGELARLGYTPRYEVIDADQDRSRFAGVLRKELLPVLKEYDYLYSFGTTAGQMVDALNRGTVPHIVNVVTDPVGAALSNNLESAGKNKGIVSNRVALDCQLDIALKVLKIQKLAFFFNPREVNSNAVRAELERLALERGFKLVEYRTVPGSAALKRKLEELRKRSKEIDAVYLPMDSYLISQAALIGRKLKEAGIPSIGAHRKYVSEGALVGMVPDYQKLGRVAANMLDRHYKGEELEDIPVYFDSSPQVVINETTRKALHVKIPKDVAKKATLLP